MRAMIEALLVVIIGLLLIPTPPDSSAIENVGNISRVAKSDQLYPTAGMSIVRKSDKLIPAGNVRISNHNKSLPVVGFVNDTMLEFKVDTGASIVVLKSKDAAKIGQLQEHGDVV